MNQILFRQRLRQALDDANMTPADLARRSGISKATISRYLNGERSPKASALSTLAYTLAVSVDWLEGRVDNDAPPISQLEQAVLDFYRSAPEDVRKLIDTLVSRNK